MAINYEYLKEKFKEEGLSMKDVSLLLGHNEQWLSYNKSMNKDLSEEDVEKLKELLTLDEDVLLGKKRKEQASVDDALTNLIVEIGKLSERVSQIEKQLENPVTVSIPMHPKEMAIRVMKDLLAGGVCSRDDVLVAFNEHHIPVEYITDGLKANNAISATSGVSTHARTFYIVVDVVE